MSHWRFRRDWAYDSNATRSAACALHDQACIPNILIKIPGTREGLSAIEDCIFAGIPINVTLLFSREQYEAAATAYIRGIERRIAIGLKPVVTSVASVFVSRWDAAVVGKVSPELSNRLGIAMAMRIYKCYRDLMASPRWQRTLNMGAHLQRLLFASTGTKSPSAPDVLYPEALAAPLTVNTMPEDTLTAFADHGRVQDLVPQDGGDCEATLAEFEKAGVDLEQLAEKLQSQGAESFSTSWDKLLKAVESKVSGIEIPNPRTAVPVHSGFEADKP